jgi:hypothetical protein
MSDSPYSIKALADRTLEIRVAWGWDAHNERFVQGVTDFDTDNYPTPPVAYYHGYTKDGKRSKKPIYIGKTISREDRADGHYLTAKLNDKPEADAVWQAAQKGVAAASPGTATHLIRREGDGTLTYWPIVEISAWDNPDGKHPQAHAYSVARPVLKALGIDIDDDNPEALPEADEAVDAGRPDSTIKEYHMTPEEVQAAITAALDAERAKVAAESAAAATLESAKVEAVKAARAQWEAESAQSRRLPDGKAPIVTAFHGVKKYDHLSADDVAFLGGMLNSTKSGKLASDQLYRALAIKSAEGKDASAIDVQRAMKAMGIDPADFLNATKANELDYTTQAGFGDEWVAITWNNQVWNVVRAPASITGLLPTIEIPQGSESVYDPLEGADPTFYKVAQTTDNNATTGRPDATVTASKLATDRVLHTATKIGARVEWSGEMEEDSIIPFVTQLRTQLAIAAAENVEHVIIDGDTDLSATTNINLISGTPGATAVYTSFDGFRKLALVTNTANSRSAAGALADTDYLNTAKLMGTAGLLGADTMRTIFIQDANTRWKALQLASLKTKDVFSNATLENGEITGIWGYKVFTSYHMHKQSAKRMANTAGKIDGTDSNNTTGAILAVRPDYWKLAYKRRMTMETSRFPEADANQIVVLMRIGLKYRDTEASAISYNVGV